MKKLFTILALCLLCIFCAISVAACEDSNDGSNTDTTHTHEYMEMVITPTCTAGGYTMHVCTCKDWYKDNETPALGHSYEWTTTKQPTETENGVKTGVCTRCGDTITQFIPASNHEHDYIITVVPATCTAGGYTLHKCACGNEYKDNETPALGHNFGEWKITRQPTCTETGIETKYCSRNNTHTETREIFALEHNYNTVVTEPTCTEQGFTTYTCTRCGDSYVDNYVVALGHSPLAAVEENREEPTCTEDGGYVLVVYCSVCHIEISRENKVLPVMGHDYDEWTITTTPTCTENGEKCGICSRCGDEKTETINTLGHNFQNDICLNCGLENPPYTKGLIFSLTDNNSSYIVSGYEGNDTQVAFGETYNGKLVTGVQNNAFKDNGSLTSVTIPDSVTSIGEGAFRGCSKLESITIPFVGGSRKTASDTYQYPFGYIFGTSSYTGGTSTKQYYYDSSTSWTTYTTYYIPSSLRKVTVTGGNILYGAFYGCSGVTRITISDSVTSIGYYAFYNCSNLTSITIPDSVTSIGSSAFYNCSSLTSITVDENNVNYKSIDGNLYSKDGKTLIKYATGKTDTEFTIPDSVTSIGSGAFMYCSSLTSITIGNSVTSIGSGAFMYCSSLISVTIGNSVTSIGGNAFRNCSSLTSINIPDSVTSIGGSAFYNCSSLTSITIPDSVTSIGGDAFYNCSSLTNISIPDSVTSIGEGAFGGCSKLESITIPFVGGYKGATTARRNTLFGYIFGTNMYTGSEATNQSYKDDYYTDVHGNIYFYREEYYIPISLKQVTITGGNILYHAFQYCSNLTSITILDSVTSIGNYAFSGCSSLTNITIPDSVTSIGVGAFELCSSLRSITIGNSVTSIGHHAFYGCSSLISVTIGNSVTSIGGSAFYGCDSLTSVMFERKDIWRVAVWSDMYSATRLSSSELANTTNAAKLLKNTYRDYWWRYGYS